MPPFDPEPATIFDLCSSCIRRAWWAPTLPKLWTATLAPFKFSLTFLPASRVAYIMPRDVASSRPSEPPMTRGLPVTTPGDRKSTRLNSSHSQISYAVFCLKKKKKEHILTHDNTVNVR